VKRLFLDTEFNGFGGALISMALVGNDCEFYEVKRKPSEAHPWVAENVIPVLAKDAVGPMLFKIRLHRFLSQYSGDGVEIIADWPSDFEHLFRELHGIDHEGTLAVPIVARLDPSINYSSELPHNALADARAIMVAYRP
jgi:hypothetical protein